MKIVIYGLGNNYERNKNWLLNKHEIVALADGNPQKQGTMVDGYKVLAKEEIVDISCDKVVVTPDIFPEIVHELLCCGISQSKIATLSDMKENKADSSKLSICFRIGGGMGDAIVALNYINAFRRVFKRDCYVLDLAVELGGFPNSERVVMDIVESWPYGRVFARPEKVDTDYDLTINLLRFPDVMNKNVGKIVRISPELLDYILLCEKFKMTNPRFFCGQYVPDGDSAYIAADFGQIRLQQPDVYGYLGLGEEYELDIPADKQLLKKLDLHDKEYVTLHFGGSPKHFKYHSVKTWPAENYEQILTWIHEEYPNFKTVMLGEEYEKSTAIRSYDYSLVGKLSIQELKAVLKYATLHVDIEGGLVHLRHALHGGASVVLFGPTLPSFYGYKENKNLRTGACPCPCEWVTDDWARNCVRESEKNICMKSLRPEYVMSFIRKILNGEG